MAQKVSAKRYAQAIFELALREEQTEAWSSQLEMAEGVLQDPEFNAFLKHADVSIEQKTRSIDAVLSELHPLVRNTMHVLVARGLVDLAPEIRESYAELLDQHLGRQRIGVTSAVDLDQAELDRIAAFVSRLIRKEVVVSTQVDESILGGVVINIGDQLLDGSTRSRLELLRTRLHSPATAPGS